MGIYFETKDENKKVVSTEGLQEGFNMGPLYDRNDKRRKYIEKKIYFILKKSEDILPKDYHSNLGNYLKQEASTEPVYNSFDNFLVDVYNKLERILYKKIFEDVHTLFNIPMEIEKDKLEKKETYLEHIIEDRKRLYEKDKKEAKQMLNKLNSLPEGWLRSIERFA